MIKSFSPIDNVPLLEISADTVYTRTNFSKAEKYGIPGWEYDEEQMTKDEFIENLQKEKESLKIGQAQTGTALLELMEAILLGGV